MKNKYLKIKFDYFVNIDLDVNQIYVGNTYFKFETHPSQHKESINMTLKDIQAEEHIYDFLLKRIFLPIHKNRIKCVFNYL